MRVPRAQRDSDLTRGPTPTASFGFRQLSDPTDHGGRHDPQWTTTTRQSTNLRKKEKNTLGEGVGKSRYFAKTTSSQTNTHTASARRPQYMLDLPHWLHRACPTVFTQQTNHYGRALLIFNPLS